MTVCSFNPLRARFNHLWILTSLLCLNGAPLFGRELRPIFNGKNLDGWKKVGGAEFEVRDGVIIAKTGDGSFGWLCTEKNLW